MSGTSRFASRWLVLGLILGWLTLALPAHAERVVVFRPLAPHPMLEEIFNRLRGELQMHGLVVLIATAPGPPDAELLKAGVERGAARAAIALSEGDGTAVVEVWFGSATEPLGKLETRLETADAEGASELALRTVELVRASLEQERPATVGSPPASTSPPEAVAPPRPPLVPSASRFQPNSRLRLEAAWSVDAGESAWGPLIAWGTCPWPHLELGFTFTGPMLGAEFQTTHAQARVTWIGLGPELRYHIPFTSLRLELLTNLLAERISVEGRGSAPVLGRDDASWVGALGAGLALAVPLSQKLELTAGFRAKLAWPRPTLAMEESRVTLGRPTFLASSGMIFGL